MHIKDVVTQPMLTFGRIVVMEEERERRVVFTKPEWATLVRAAKIMGRARDLAQGPSDFGPEYLYELDDGFVRAAVSLSEFVECRGRPHIRVVEYDDDGAPVFPL